MWELEKEGKMQVIGSAEEARGLSQAIVTRTRTVFELTNGIKGSLNSLQGSFQDEGFNELEDIVMKVYQSINAHLDDVKSLQGALHAYAEVLERRN